MESPLLFILGIALLSAGIVYGLFHILLIVGLLRIEKKKKSAGGRISVIVAARNESDSIGLLLEALLLQTRLPEEVIVVDDRSTDDTGQKAASFRSRFPSLTVITVDRTPPDVAPKKHALATGIAASTGDILCFTDADCLPPREWIQTLISSFGPKTGVVVGTHVFGPHPSGDRRQNGLLRSFLNYESFKATVLTAGSIGAGYPWMASGSSMAYRREVYEAIGGFSAFQHSLSGDDDLFVQRVHRSTSWEVAFAAGPEAAVLTKAPLRFVDFLDQRLRHFSAGKSYVLFIQTMLFLYHASNLTVLVGLIGFLLGWFPTTAVAWYAVKICSDFMLLAVGGHILGRNSAWAMFIPMEFLYVLYFSLIGPLGHFVRIKWKPEPAA